MLIGVMIVLLAAMIWEIVVYLRVARIHKRACDAVKARAAMRGEWPTDELAAMNAALEATSAIYRRIVLLWVAIFVVWLIIRWWRIA